MSSDKSDILSESLLLLELALIIGRLSGCDLTSRCHEFLKILMSRKNLSYGSVWIRSDALRREGEADVLELVEALPHSRMDAREVSVSHPSIVALKDARFYIVRDSDPEYQDMQLASKVKPGCLVFFRLGDIGQLRLNSHDQNSFLTREANQLYSVIETFTISLEGALSEARFRAEMDERKQVEEQLRQAERLKAVGQLTGGVAHDFNNLLAVIQGCAEFLQMEPKHDQEMVETILSATERGAELTHRLLAYARQQPLKAESVDVAALVDDMLQLLCRSLGQSVSLNLDCAEDLWCATVDPRQLEDALLNLAINARDAMPDGGQLTIECRNVELDEVYQAQNPDVEVGDYVMLAVSDTGTGIPLEIRDQIFEPFFTTKDHGQGNGLGLSTIYGFARQSGGHLGLYTEVGSGTTFRLYLPRAVAEPATRGSNEHPAERLGNGERVLVLEDDPAVRKLAVRSLEALSYTPCEAADTNAALEQLTRITDIRLLLSDVALPGGANGPQFVKSIRFRFPELRVVFMSGFPPEAAKRSGILEAGSNLLNKPFTRNELAGALQDALLGETPAMPLRRSAG